MRIVFFKTAYTKSILIKIPMIIFGVSYSDFNERRVVMVPAPAMIGKARGTIELDSGASSLKKFTPSTISSAMKKITNEPAMANDEISSPMMLNKSSPKNKNTIIKIIATIVALPDCICPALFLNCITTGIEPRMSMMAKSTMLTENISLRLKNVFIDSTEVASS